MWVRGNRGKARGIATWFIPCKVFDMSAGWWCNSVTICALVDYTSNSGNKFCKFSHLENNRKSNYSIIPIMSPAFLKQKEKIKNPVGCGVVLFRDYSDLFSKPEKRCQPFARLPVWTLMSGNRTVHAETLMTELC